MSGENADEKLADLTGRDRSEFVPDVPTPEFDPDDVESRGESE